MTSELQICPFCLWAGQGGLDKLSDDAVQAEIYCAPWKLMALQQSFLSGILKQVLCMLSMDKEIIICGDLSMWAPVQLERCDPCPAPTVPTYGYPLR